MAWHPDEPLLHSQPPAVRQAVSRLEQSVTPTERRAALRGLIVELGPEVSVFVIALSRAVSMEARRLALELFIRLRRPRRTVRRHALQLLPQRDLPLGSRVAAARTLLRHVDPNGDSAVQVLRSLARGLGRSRRMARLDRLAVRLGNPPALERVRAELVQHQKLRCPRCGVMRRRRRMAEHLWNRHQLLLDGHRALSPLQALDARLEDPDLVATLTELHRRILCGGLKDDEALRHLCEQAGDRGESVCPSCFGAVSGREPPPIPAPLTPHRLTVGEWTVSRTLNVLQVEADGQIVVEGPGGGSTWPRVLRALSAASAVAAAVAAASLPSPWHAVAAAALLGEATALIGLAGLLRSTVRDECDRLIDIAWEHVAKRSGPEAAIGRLALASIGRGTPQRRSAALHGAIAAAGRETPPGVLAALWWLAAHDKTLAGGDPLPELAGRVGDCLAGSSELAAGSSLVEFAQADEYEMARQSRLRVLCCEQAFVHGLGVWDILEIGRAYPALGRVFGVADLDGLARLRLIWGLRADRPWQTCGPASTVFELARYPALAAAVLKQAPDLLLYQPMPQSGAENQPEAILLCGRGILYGDAVLRDASQVISVCPLERWRGGGFELRLGPHRRRVGTDPTPLAERLRRWAEYFLRDLLPRADSVLRFRAGTRLDELLRPSEVKCPDCERRVIPVVGSLAFDRE